MNIQNIKNSPQPLAIVDIGSNSVRLVVYEDETRVPAIVYNEKAMCGLGSNVILTGLLPEEGMASASKAIARYKKLSEMMGVRNIRIMATAAVRDARNGKEFLHKVKELWDVPVELVPGEREAYLSSLGIIAGFYLPDGVMGDLGGGSLELSSISQFVVGNGVSMPLGGLALRDISGGNLKEAYKFMTKTLKKAGEQIALMKGRSFYAVGGTWRTLAKIHQIYSKYPVHFMHGYVMKPDEIIPFLKEIESGNKYLLDLSDDISEPRKPLLPYGALVLQELIKQGQPKEIIISSTGVRDGILFEHLRHDVQTLDPLSDAIQRISLRRSRSQEHSYELSQWARQFIRSTTRNEFINKDRMIHIMSVLSDISWRSHPDYRAEHALALVECAYLLGIDHPLRSCLAITLFCRYAGVNSTDSIPQGMLKVAGDDLVLFARLMAAIIRVGYAVSVATSGVLPKTPLLLKEGEVVLSLPLEFEQLANGRLLNRLRQLGKILDCQARIEMNEA